MCNGIQDALDRYPHTIVELTGSNVTAATLDWAEGEGIDILVMGELPNAHAASTYVTCQKECAIPKPLPIACKPSMSLCTGFRDAKVKAAMTKVIPGEWGLGSVSGRTLQHTRVCLGPPFLEPWLHYCLCLRDCGPHLSSAGSRTRFTPQVPLLVVRPDAALKLNKLRTQQPSMAAGSVDQAGSLMTTSSAGLSGIRPGVLRKQAGRAKKHVVYLPTTPTPKQASAGGGCGSCG
jgi:hypothetical protein